MQLFYFPEISSDDPSVTFDKEESRHIVKVLRKSAGDILHVTNGNGSLFQVEIAVASENKCIGRIISSEQKPKSDFNLHIAVAPTKLIDRYEWFLEKATEMGIHEITPIICDHSERKVIKSDRLEKIVQSAMKQSLQVYLPKLNPQCTFKEFLKLPSSSIKLIAHCEETERKSLKEAVLPGTDVLILVGPEGDFSPSEIQLALASGFQPITLGSTRLRTETAAVAACCSVNFINS